MGVMGEGDLRFRAIGPSYFRPATDLAPLMNDPSSLGYGQGALSRWLSSLRRPAGPEAEVPFTHQARDLGLLDLHVIILVDPSSGGGTDRGGGSWVLGGNM